MPDLRATLLMPGGAFTVRQDPGNARDIEFGLRPDVPIIPDEQAQLRDDIDRTLSSLRLIYPDGDKRFGGAFRSLLALGQTGLTGEHPQPAVATRALVMLKADLTAREAGHVKNRYLRMLGINALVLGAPAFLAAWVLSWLLPAQHTPITYLLLWGGCMGGVWLSFGIRRTTLTFDDLAFPEQDRLEPPVRLVFAGLLTMLVGLLLSTKVIDLTLGGVQATALHTNPSVAVLLGALCGISEQALPSQLAKKVTTLMQWK